MSYTVPDRTTVRHCTQKVIYSLRALRLYTISITITHDGAFESEIGIKLLNSTRTPFFSSSGNIHCAIMSTCAYCSCTDISQFMSSHQNCSLLHPEPLTSHFLAILLLRVCRRLPHHHHVHSKIRRTGKKWTPTVNSKTSALVKGVPFRCSSRRTYERIRRTTRPAVDSRPGAVVGLACKSVSAAKRAGFAAWNSTFIVLCGRTASQVNSLRPVHVQYAPK